MRAASGMCRNPLASGSAHAVGGHRQHSEIPKSQPRGSHRRPRHCMGTGQSRCMRGGRTYIRSNGASAMSKIGFLLTLLVTVLVCLLPAAPAQAQSNRTFVSAAGSDSNNCATVSTPCRHLANAYAATAANGEIDVLDPANYGALTITGPVTIEGHGWASIAAVSEQEAITINAKAGDKINIIGVVLDGIAITNTTGILFFSGGTLNIRDSVIRNFALYGIIFQPNSSSSSQLFVSNTLVSDNGSDAINISPAGSGTDTGVLSHVEMENNLGNGLFVSSSTQTINVTITASVSANN